MFPLWLIVVVVVIIFLLLGFFWWGLKHGILLALNSVVGFFALYAVQAFLWPTLVINVWSVLITAVFGIFGFVLILILHFLGAAF